MPPPGTPAPVPSGFEDIRALGGDGQSIGSSISDLANALWGQDSTVKSSSTKTLGSTSTQQLVLDQAAIEKLIQDVLSGSGGISEIFAAEKASGIYNSTVADQQAGNFMAQLLGELAKLTGKTVETQEATSTEKSKTSNDQTGLLDRLGL